MPAVHLLAQSDRQVARGAHTEPSTGSTIHVTGILLCSTGQSQRGERRVMVARVDRGLRVAVSQYLVRLGSEALPAVFEEDPIDAARFAAVVHPLAAAQQEVPQPSERVERPRILAVLVAGGEERVLETRSEEHTSELQSRQYLVCRL